MDILSVHNTSARFAGARYADCGISWRPSTIPKPLADQRDRVSEQLWADRYAGG